MMVEVICPACLSQVEIDAKHLGRRGKCIECNHYHRVVSADKLPSITSLENHPSPRNSGQRSSFAKTSRIPELDAILVTDSKLLMDCSCGKKLKVGLSAQGKAVRCVGCQQSLRVPSLVTVDAFKVETQVDLATLDLQQPWLQSLQHSPVASSVVAHTEQFIPKTSRNYIHDRCSGVTVVFGTKFEYVANPLSHFKHLECVNCKKDFPVSEFRWEDTNEKVTQYYARHLKNVPKHLIRVAERGELFLKIGAALGFILGSLIGFLGGWVAGIIAVTILAIAGGLTFFYCYEFYLKHFVLKSIFGTKDCRMLT